VANSLRLVQFSDPHLFGSADGTLRGVATLPALQAAISHADQHFPARDAVLLTGDLVQEDAGGYARLRETFLASKEPVYCLPGNHDLPDAMVELLIGSPFQIGGHAIHENWLLVMLNTWQAGQAGGRLGPDQLRRLDELLTAHPQLHTLLCLHHHPIAMESRWLDQVGLEDAADFQAVIARQPQVRGVLWGHVHQALDQFTNGVRYMASPATCTQFLPRSKDFALDRRPPGYRVLELMPDGSIATEVVWVPDNVA
jgi:3',5'-cyclic-AMP phosphodiesterase